jgi:hypothetical protein
MQVISAPVSTRRGITFGGFDSADLIAVETVDYNFPISARRLAVGSLYGFGERTALSRTNLNFLSPEHGGITRLFDSFLSEKLNCRHDVREVHRRYCRTRNRWAEIMLRLPSQIYAIRDAATVEQHVKQDDAGGRLMQSSD